MNLYDRLTQIVLLCRLNPYISPTITVDMSWEKFVNEYYPNKCIDHNQLDTFYGYRVTKSENSFIISK